MLGSDSYQDYTKWKNWGSGPRLEPWEERYFAKEIKRANPYLFRDVLEIGFGNGEFLQWAQKMGARTVGLEIISGLVESARADGFNVYCWNLAEGDPDQNPIKGEKFDCIVAFDVIEHLPVDVAKEFLRHMADMLKPGGKILLRFPNGESPFYLPLQNGDYTHRMDVCEAKLRHLCVGSGLEIEGYYNAARVANRRSTACLKWFLFRLRDLFEIAVGYIYFHRWRPLDPAATAGLRYAESR